AAQLAGNWKARLVIAHATYSLEGRVGEYFDPDWRTQLASAANKGIAELQAEGGTTAEVIVESGDAPDVVCKAAEESKADVVVIGRGSTSGVLGRLRANAYSIIRQSPCPVVSV
ncbi:MAG: universal stress protein, partial [Bryobacteraceae bacterium]